MAKSKEIRPIYDLVYPKLGTNGKIKKKLSGLGGSYVIMGGTFNVKMLSFWGIYGYNSIIN